MPKNIKKIMHICIIITIIIVIGFTALMLILKYDEFGETNMPFDISKITIISTVDAQDVDDKNNRWNVKVSQNNDVYIDIKKNEEYQKNRIIKSITLDNFQVTKAPAKGSIEIYKPSTNNVKTFDNKEENKISEITYDGDKSTDIKNLKISNQGGRIAFRCGNNDIGDYISNDEDELNYSELLKKMNLNQDDIQSKISFDINILLTNKKSYKATVEIDIPIDGVSEKGTSSIELENPQVVFKRVDN